MQVQEYVQLFATGIEVIIALFALYISWTRQKISCGFIAITFALFVIFDIGRIFSITVSDDLHAAVFMIACLSMLYAVWLIAKENSPK